MSDKISIIIELFDIAPETRTELLQTIFNLLFHQTWPELSDSVSEVTRKYGAEYSISINSEGGENGNS